ncbi:hypothetical protein HZA75_04355, partial [Candidatus Roizmanbacteria bacterium]|nr:hypothetical protein [Candidatus Roizmanbacteria bacterium]
MADYFDFIKKPVANATVNPSQGNDKSNIQNPNVKIQMSNQAQNPNDQKMKTNGQVKPNSQGVTTSSPTTNNLDLMTHLTQRSNRVMMATTTKAKELKADMVDSEHLLYGLTTDNEIYNLLVETKV